MKRLFYFVLLLVGVATVHSCKDLLDEDGNPLLDINTNTGLNGPRALYREITDSDTLATYYYNGLQLSKVITDSTSITDVAWSGDKISKIDFRGFLDLDKNGKVEKDSTYFTQLLTYGSTGRLEKISEDRSVYHRLTTPPYSVTSPSPQMLYRKIKTSYSLVYSATTGKLESVKKISGPDISGLPSFDNYSNIQFEYVGDNISKITREYGPMTGGVNGAPTKKLGFAFTNYDVGISPFTLLPNAYKISRILSSELFFADAVSPYIIDKKNADGWILSPNSPTRISITDLTQLVPTPVLYSTDYRYDPQTYMTVGYGVNYIYKPL